MWFGVLGPLLVRNGDVVVDVPTGRHRVLLAALLLRAGTPVAADTLAEFVWNGRPPPGAGVTLRSHMSRLRQVLGPDVRERLVTRHSGYLIEAAECEVDLLRFRRLYAEGGAAARNGDWTRAWQSLDEALGLWRGSPFADVPCELLLRDEVPGLEELRLQALEWHADAGLELGRHSELVAELQPLIRAHPLREHLYAQLMLAQYRCGRQAEALATYQSARQTLAEALGADPGTELRDIHQRILTADPSLDLPAHPATSSLPQASELTVPERSTETRPRETARHRRNGARSRLLRSRAVWAMLAAAAAIVAGVLFITNALAGTASVTSPRTAAGGWLCGPSVRVTLYDGTEVGQSLQACLTSDHGHLDMKGVLEGSVDAWKEQIILIVKHPNQPTYEKLYSPVCTTSTCVYQVPLNPGHGSWRIVPQWRANGVYQSTGQPSPPVTY